MRWVFLSLVLINAMFFSWRHIMASNSADTLSSSQLEAPKLQVTPSSSVSNSPSITLLEELDASRGSPEPDVGVSTAGGGVCYWAGPLADNADRDVLLRRLEALNVEAAERVTRIAGDLHYWVYLPPLESRGQAKARLAALQEKGIDSYLIHKGERKNGISLGLFSRLELAEIKEGEVREAGWSPTMDTYKKNVSQRWVTANKDQLDAVGAGILPKMLKNKSSVTIIEKKCGLPVASHSNIH